MTNGMKSTEFWASVAAMAVGAWLAKNGADVATITAVVAPILVYCGGRSMVKAKNGK